MPPSRTATSVGRRIRDARERMGLTQAELGTHLGKTATAVSDWEGGQRSPALDDLVDIAAVLQISMSDLLPVQAPRVVARAQAALLAIEDLADVVDRVLDRFEGADVATTVPRAPTSNPAEAAGFARRRSGQRKAPVDIERVLETCGCLYAEEKMPPELQGFVVLAETTPVVVTNARDPMVRRRFTAAHEVGQVLLRHHDSFHVDFDQGEGSPPNYNWRHERAANDFAASLLMPDELVRHEVENHVRSTVGSVAKKFEVSSQAMAIRLATLGLAI